ncbi:Methyltransferase domain-containing protein [Belliella buryatensis]|uniref:Methyltransferase domain-containing protein n=1 Tax=Belliella buryatensis TaxID=1500549 RepID=A0A239FP40_9BACT|nr:class I SAM-dependent methyltransferase [Belliella buryatensis]SNS58661.1 Methyltransferase domain-containing protein [Belliella buryatensis]
MEINELNKLLGNIDIYLLDQILKGRFKKDMKILDAGCGEGRNCIFFLHQDYQIFGVDANPIAIQMARIYAQTINPKFDVYRFQTSTIENMPFHSGAFDVVISSAVLHFAESEKAFFKMLDSMMNVLKTGGIFFLRMTTAFGGIIEESQQIGNCKYLLPDGSERFLLTEAYLQKMIEKYNLSYLEPAKTVLVNHQREMGVLVFQKNS